MRAVSPPDEMMVGNDFAEYMRETEPEAKVLPVSSFREQFAAFRAGGKASVGATLPWAKTHADIHFRPGEVTVWAGENGSGKSMVLSHTLLGLMLQQHKCVTLSFEMKPVRQVERFVRQFAGCKEVADYAVEQFFDWGGGRLWFYDQQGTVQPQMVYAVCRYAAKRLKATHVVVDSLMKVVRKEDDYNAQKDFVDMLTSIARDTDLHIHLVHHMRKVDDPSRVGGKSDIKGSGAITDLVDNVLTVWRNRGKEAIRAKQAEGRLLTEKEEEKLNGPDVVLGCEKQRNGEWEGRIALWFHQPSFQYIGDKYCRPVSIADMVLR